MVTDTSIRSCSLIPLLQYLPGFAGGLYWRLRENILQLETLFSLPLDYLLSLLPKSAHSDFRDLYRNRQDSDLWRCYQRDQQRLAESGISTLTHEDREYPELLLSICQPPPVLYVRGNVSALDVPQLAFVGSRNATVSGRETAFDFARYLADSGFAITSGLASGIDAQAHRGALATEGITVAVLGTGIDRVYPARHQNLADTIVEQGGALVSEFLPGTRAHGGNFPRRNRIISGLSLGVVVVEAALQSGSLITARYALEQNREVFAIPGSIHNPLSRGCHALIRDGAALVETAQDIAQELRGWCGSRCGAESRPEQEPEQGLRRAAENVVLSEEEQRLWDNLGFEVIGLDQLLGRTGLATAEAIASLMSLELKGLVATVDGGYQRL